MTTSPKSPMSPKYEQIARDTIDFINQQVGVYSDACSGFSKNRSIVERQVHRVVRPSGSKIGDDGIPVVMSTSVEDPSQPDVIIHRILLATEYLKANAEGGSNEQQNARSVLIFVFANWDEEIRPRMAKSLGCQVNNVTSDIFGDIRLVRNGILHNKGILSGKDHAKLKVTTDLFEPDMQISLSNTVMHRLFYLIKKDMARRILIDSGAAETAPFNIDDVNQVAFQRLGH